MNNIYHGYTEPREVIDERGRRIKLQGEIIILEQLVDDSDCDCSPISDLACAHCQWVSELKEKRAELQRIQGNVDLYFYRR